MEASKVWNPHGYGQKSLLVANRREPLFVANMVETIDVLMSFFHMVFQCVLVACLLMIMCPHSSLIVAHRRWLTAQCRLSLPFLNLPLIFLVDNESHACSNYFPCVVMDVIYGI